MTVNHIPTPPDTPSDAVGRKRTERVLTLIALRERLAAASAAYEAHGIVGALDLFLEVCAVEDQIRRLAPRIYDQRWSDWAEADAALLHTPQTPHPRCYICCPAQAA